MTDQPKKLPRAIAAGEINLNGTKIPCAVLDDGRRVLSQRTLMHEMQITQGGNVYRRARDAAGSAEIAVFIAHRPLKPFVPAGLTEPPKLPSTYAPHAGGEAYAIDAATAIAICDVWKDAAMAGALRTEAQRRTAQAAHRLTKGLTVLGLISLIDEATWFQYVRERDALAKILDRLLANDLQPYSRHFPPDYYRQIFRLRGWTFEEASTKRPMLVAQITADLIYDRMAPGALEALRARTPKTKGGRRAAKLHQSLAPDEGVLALHEQIASVTTIAKMSSSWAQFIDRMNRLHPRFGRTMLLNFPEPEAA